MPTGGGYAIATALISTTIATSSLATPFNITQNQTSLQSDEFLLAGDYRHQRHIELEQQMRNEMNKPHNSQLFQSQKENIIRQSHEVLDQNLNRQREQFRREFENNSQRFSDFSNCTGLSCSSQFPNSQRDRFFPTSPNCTGLSCPSSPQTFPKSDSPFSSF